MCLSDIYFILITFCCLTCALALSEANLLTAITCQVSWGKQLYNGFAPQISQTHILERRFTRSCVHRNTAYARFIAPTDFMAHLSSPSSITWALPGSSQSFHMSLPPYSFKSLTCHSLIFVLASLSGTRPPRTLILPELPITYDSQVADQQSQAKYTKGADVRPVGLQIRI